jgi:hypothetical protein
MSILIAGNTDWARPVANSEPWTAIGEFTPIPITKQPRYKFK